MKLKSLALVVALAGCNLLSSSQQANITNFLTGVANKQTTDLQIAQSVALAATPPAVPQANCAGALLDVQADVQKVVSAASARGAGVFTAAVIASLFQPGSPQANGERDKIVAGCSVFIVQVTGEVAGTAAFFGQIAAQFAIPLPRA